MLGTCWPRFFLAQGCGIFWERGRGGKTSLASGAKGQRRISACWI